jgi:hypothetical protein
LLLRKKKIQNQISNISNPKLQRKLLLDNFIVRRTSWYLSEYCSKMLEDGKEGHEKRVKTPPPSSLSIEEALDVKRAGERDGTALPGQGFP